MDRAFAEHVPESRRHPNIAVVEAYAMEAAFNRWAPFWTHGEFVLYTDNTTLYHVLTNATSRGPIIDPLRRILVKAASLDILLLPAWLPSKSNDIADALSRFDATRLTNLFPRWSQIDVWLPRWNGRPPSALTMPP